MVVKVCIIQAIIYLLTKLVMPEQQITIEQIEEAKKQYSEEELKDMQEEADERWVPLESIIEEAIRANDL